MHIKTSCSNGNGYGNNKLFPIAGLNSGNPNLVLNTNMFRCLLIVVLRSLLWITVHMSSVAIQSTCQSNDVILNFGNARCYTRADLYSLRSSAGRPDLDRLDSLGLLRYRGTRAGRHVRMRRERRERREREYHIGQSSSIHKSTTADLNFDRPIEVVRCMRELKLGLGMVIVMFELNKL